jgi:hypothetical protein
MSPTLTGRGALPAGVSQPIGDGSGFDDVAGEGQPVDGLRRRGVVVKVLVQPENDSLLAIATELLSSLSVNT